LPGSPPPPDCVPPFLSFVGNLACFLLGSLEPLSQETMDELYKNHGSYVSQIAHRSNDLVAERFLLMEDAKLHRLDAAQSSVGMEQ